MAKLSKLYRTEFIKDVNGAVLQGLSLTEPIKASWHTVWSGNKVFQHLKIDTIEITNIIEGVKANLPTRVTGEAISSKGYTFTNVELGDDWTLVIWDQRYQYMKKPTVDNELTAQITNNTTMIFRGIRLTEVQQYY